MTLFLSDLDGTLVDGRLTIPPDSAAGINAAIARGDGFTVATARTPATVKGILEPIRGALPAIVMNGAGVFDFEREEYLWLAEMSREKAQTVLDALDRLHMDGFLYTVDGCRINVYYRELENLSQRMFLEARTGKPYKTFFQGEAPEKAWRVFFCVIDSEERTARLAAALREIPGHNVFHYRDVHDPENWYVEVYDASASKAAGVRFLRERYGFSRVVAFGDNHNDRPLFEAADESYAVAGAVDELKKAATGVLEKPDIGAVGRFIGAYGK